MPTVTCPGCGRAIRLRRSEMSLTIECIGCDTRFSVGGTASGPSPIALSGDIERPSPDHEEASPRRTWPLLALSALGAASVLAVVLVLLYRGAPQVPDLAAAPPPSPEDAPRAVPPPTAATRQDPYPECAAIRTWLGKHAYDPAALEVVEWQSRQLIRPPSAVRNARGPAPAPAGPESVRIRALLRGRNRHGALVTSRADFSFWSDGRLTGTVWTQDDPREQGAVQLFDTVLN
jgi:hypothetical protein